MNALEQAVEACGGVRALANSLGITPQAVYLWQLRGRPPAERVLAIEAATEGAVTRYELRPDIYPREDA